MQRRKMEVKMEQERLKLERKQNQIETKSYNKIKSTTLRGGVRVHISEINLAVKSQQVLKRKLF